MQFLCDKCGMLFTKNKSLLRHVRTIHQGMKRTDNEKRKAANEKEKRLKIAESILKNKEVIIKHYPEEAICFHFVKNKAWTEDMKRKAEASFEDIFKACDKTFVFVEYESTHELTDEGKLVMTDKLVSQLEL